MSVENVEEKKGTRTRKRKLVPEVIGSVDKTIEDVVEYVKEGRELFFEDGKKNFLKLPDKVIADLSVTSKERYRWRLALRRAEKNNRCSKYKNGNPNETK